MALRMLTRKRAPRIATQSREFTKIPRHIGIIPDGNRRWAHAHGLQRHEGYEQGLNPALNLVETCQSIGVEELSFYGFTQDNTKRAAVQRRAFQQACVEAVALLRERDINILVVGNTASTMFPRELLKYTFPRRTRRSIQVNLLVNYSWQWDISQAFSSRRAAGLSVNDRELAGLGSEHISRIDLILRWGGRRRLSGFLPIQTVYSDFYVFDEFWPDYNRQHLEHALDWYQMQDATLGG